MWCALGIVWCVEHYVVTIGVALHCGVGMLRFVVYGVAVCAVLQCGARCVFGVVSCVRWSALCCVVWYVVCWVDVGVWVMWVELGCVVAVCGLGEVCVLVVFDFYDVWCELGLVW